MVNSKANLRVICLPFSRRPAPGMGSDYNVYFIEPWLEKLSSKFNIVFHNECDFKKRSLNERVLIIGHLPYSWTASMKSEIDGFMHIIIDKYLFQSSPLPVKFRSSFDAYRLVKNLYRDFKPGLVVVNSEVMKSDFKLNETHTLVAMQRHISVIMHFGMKAHMFHLQSMSQQETY